MSAPHETVMLHEVVKLVTGEGQHGGLYVDATLGGGGHAEGLLKIRDDIRVLGLDCDPIALTHARIRLQNFGERFQAVRARFDQISEILTDPGLAGAVMDLGVSSYQFDTGERGFSFQRDGPLDMRMDPSDSLTASEVIHRWKEEELARIFWEYGEERFSRRIARAIVEKRRVQPLQTTGELAELVVRCVGRKRSEFRIHPATRIFQALRIVVNDELGRLERGLDQLWNKLNPHGRIAVLSFHSLEDRIVKVKFRRWKGETTGKLITPKPLRPTEKEIARNPRSRSAKLRVVEKRPSSPSKTCPKEEKTF